MSITAAFVLFAVVWFMVLFITLPIGLKTQADVGQVEPGTPASAPADPQLKKRALIVTAISIVVWAIIVGIIVSGKITVRDIDWMGRMPPPSVPQSGDVSQ